MRFNDYRARVLDWLHDVKRRVQPLQGRLNKHITTGPKEVAGHVQTVLLFILLSLSGYANPQMAFRFFTGAPIVDVFSSPALRQRTVTRDEFNDHNIYKVARESERSLKSVSDDLTDGAAAKSQEKMQKEFDSGTLLGPFDTGTQLEHAI